MKRYHLAVPVKLWALACAILGVSLTGAPLMTCILTATGFLYLAVQRNWRLMVSFGVFYGILALLLCLIDQHGVRLAIFSEFHVLMFWNLSAVLLVGWDLITTPPGELASFLSRICMPTAVILGLLVMFRFFPTMKAEFKCVVRSMRNRGLTSPSQMLLHPAASCEYVLVPLLLRCLQIADQLSVSAVARGADAPGRRGSYDGRALTGWDWCWLALWPAVTFCVLWMGGIRL